MCSLLQTVITADELYGDIWCLNQVSSCFSSSAECCNSVLLWSSRTVKRSEWTADSVDAGRANQQCEATDCRSAVELLQYSKKWCDCCSLWGRHSGPTLGCCQKQTVSALVLSAGGKKTSHALKLYKFCIHTENFHKNSINQISMQISVLYCHFHDTWAEEDPETWLTGSETQWVGLVSIIRTVWVNSCVTWLTDDVSDAEAELADGRVCRELHLLPHQQEARRRDVQHDGQLGQHVTQRRRLKTQISCQADAEVTSSIISVFTETHRQHRDLVDVGPAADLQGDLSDRGPVRRVLTSRDGVRADDIIFIRVHDDDIVVVCGLATPAPSGPAVLRFRRHEGADGPEPPVDLTEDTNKHTPGFISFIKCKDDNTTYYSLSFPVLIFVRSSSSCLKHHK